MSREIEFRAWVTKENSFTNEEDRMFTGFSFKDIYSGYDEANIFCKDGTLEEPKWDKIVIMQYTGLKDKNGVKIFEGDVVQSTPSYKDILRSIVGEDMADGREIYGVFFSDGCFQLYDIDGEFVCDLFQIVSACELVGNIYENPELLNLSQQKDGE